MSRLPEPAPAGLSFQYLAEIAVGATTRVDLSRITGPRRSGELCAVKRLHAHLEEDAGVATEFLDEVWMTASLKHPSVVEVVGWGKDEQGSYLAVELVQGVSLMRLMKTVTETREAFPERLVVYAAAQICRGLAAAHGLRAPSGELLNLVHRDLTPGNVLVGFQGEVKIADFGLAKAKLRMTRTLTGTLKGEPTYMAPEQAKGTEIDRRADLFALGVMMFELFAGQHPWAAPTEFEMVHLIATAPPADLRELRPKIDKGLVTLVNRCLEKDPAARYQSAEEILARLDEWLHAHGYQQGSQEALARFVRRNAMRQMRWFERAMGGELAPTGEAMPVNQPPAARPPPPPRADSYLGGPITVLGAKGVPLVKAPPGAERDEERTEITADVHARFKAGRDPVDELSDDEMPTGPIGGWGNEEDGPTLIKKGRTFPLPRSIGQLIAAPESSVTSIVTSKGDSPSTIARIRGPHDTLLDEESDARTTAVKAVHLPAPRLPAPLPAPLPVPPLAAPPASPITPGAAPGLLDVSSEELPTMPLKGDNAFPMLPSNGRAPGLPGHATSPPPPPPPGSSSMPPLPGRSSPPPGALGPLPPPRGPSFPPPGGGAASVAAPFRTTTPLELSESRSLATPPDQRVVAEAERLAREAARLREEAERLAASSRAVSQAAAMAAEAVRLLSSGGATEAARRLEEALHLERSASAGIPASSPVAQAPSLPPPPPPPPPSSPSLLHESASSPAFLAGAKASDLPAFASSSAPFSSPQPEFQVSASPHPTLRLTGNGVPGSGAAIASVPPPSSYLHRSTGMSGGAPLMPAALGPDGAAQGLVTGGAGGLQPDVPSTLFGMSKLLVLLFVGVFVLVLGLLFLVFS
ncbi:serine/threonine protein kinase [Chondromyces crocatus]|uniref:Protein kinase domain-containing protein n=1 Tax=Chondromyces crocatus TaxID=52 RepID=A0A0K1EHQ5_CHOCO|nr:serine/threonine-protein kinase [Chondromyces crocatus]AKT40212.1 uncharacterized protein CMC5_043650 [Chondromyces crocatus]